MEALGREVAIPVQAWRSCPDVMFAKRGRFECQGVISLFKNERRSFCEAELEFDSVSLFASAHILAGSSVHQEGVRQAPRTFFQGTQRCAQVSVCSSQVYYSGYPGMSNVNFETMIDIFGHAMVRKHFNVSTPKACHTRPPMPGPSRVPGTSLSASTLARGSHTRCWVRPRIGAVAYKL